MRHAELPYLGAGIVALVGGARRQGGWPKYGIEAVVAMIVLVVVASATNGTRLAPLVRAIGMLLLLGAVYGAARSQPPRQDGGAKQRKE